MKAVYESGNSLKLHIYLESCSVHAYMHTFVHSSVSSFIRSFVHLFIHSFVYSFICRSLFCETGSFLHPSSFLITGATKGASMTVETTYPLTSDKIEFDSGLISSSSSEDNGSLILSIFPCLSSFQERKVSSNSFEDKIEKPFHHKISSLEADSFHLKYAL